MPHYPTSQERESNLRLSWLRGADDQKFAPIEVSHDYVGEQLSPTAIESCSFSCHDSLDESCRISKGKATSHLDETTRRIQFSSTISHNGKFSRKLACIHGSILLSKRLNHFIAISYALIIAIIPENITRGYFLVPAMKFAVAMPAVDQDEGKVLVTGSDTENNTKMDESKEDNVDDLSPPKQDEPIASEPSEDNHLPHAIAKATLVGAKLRGNVDDGDEDVANPVNYTETSSEINDHPIRDDNIQSPNVNKIEEVSGVEEESPRNPKPPLTGCHWGAAGCNKGTKIPMRQNIATNASVSQSSGQVTASSPGASPSPSSSSLAGSTTAAIEARVNEARGGNRKPKNNVHSSSSASSPSIKASGDDSNDSHTYMPPQGFRLTARIVTSPSDGLAYFLDSLPSDPNDEEHDWLMGIPYTYVKCGPTIESTTEAFSITDMVARHFPAGAAPGHWVNLGGGVTLDSKSIATDGESGPRYLNGNLHDGHPKLLVALSPVEITVSGNFEETRVFQPGDVLLLEDTLGKGHKMRAVPSNTREDGDGRPHFGAYSQDMSVLMISLPHTIHYPIYDWNNPAYVNSKSSERSESTSSNTPNESPTSSTVYSGAQHSLFGLRPKQNRRGDHPRGNFHINKPCPLEYDSAYSSLFKPIPTRRGRHRTRRRDPHWKKSSKSTMQTTPFDNVYHPPPGLTTYSRDDEFVLLNFLPSLRRTMLVGLGLSLTSSFVYCVQLLYPPLLALWGGATVVVVGSVLNVAGMRFGYREWIEVWEQEWRWRREVKNQKKRRTKIKGESLQKSQVNHGVNKYEGGKTNNSNPNQVSRPVESVADDFSDKLDANATLTAEIYFQGEDGEQQHILAGQENT